MKIEKEALSKISDSLGTAIYHLTWAGHLFGPLSVIPLARMRLAVNKMEGRAADGFSAISSIYYTAWGNAMARAKQQKFLLSALYWLARGYWYLWLAIRASDKVLNFLGYAKMSVGMLDIRASILTATFWRVDHLKDALACIMEPFGRPDNSKDDIALLLRKKGEICYRMGDIDLAHYAFEAALKERPVMPSTRVRVLRSYIWYSRKQQNDNQAKRFANEAIELAEMNNLGDQIIKIKSLMGWK
jgi:tetratricopeptide (TPR) repeat protein